jgi:hypothetical protein
MLALMEEKAGNVNSMKTYRTDGKTYNVVMKHRKSNRKIE